MNTVFDSGERCVLASCRRSMVFWRSVVHQQAKANSFTTIAKTVTHFGILFRWVYS